MQSEELASSREFILVLVHEINKVFAVRSKLTLALLLPIDIAGVCLQFANATFCKFSQEICYSENASVVLSIASRTWPKRRKDSIQPRMTDVHFSA